MKMRMALVAALLAVFGMAAPLSAKSNKDKIKKQEENTEIAAEESAEVAQGGEDILPEAQDTEIEGDTAE